MRPIVFNPRVSKPYLMDFIVLSKYIIPYSECDVKRNRMYMMKYFMMGMGRLG